MAKIQSVEPNIADLANGWLKSYKLDYKLEQESLNTEIDQALNDYYSKNGGVGGNRPDAKLLLQDKNLVNYPILIEYKGYKDKLVKLDVDGKVANKTAKNQPDFKNINSYAVNGAVHYANALLHYTSYTDIIAIGMTGYKNDAGKLEYEIGVYYVSKSNFGVGQKVDDFTDLSFLKKSNFDAFIEKVKQLQLSQEEIEKLREHREQEINASLVKLNNDIYNNEKGLSERDRVYLVAASIIATLGVPGKVAALEKSELKSSTEEGNRDGDIILRKIKAFLGEKNLPQEKRDLIVRTLQNTLTTDNINKVEDGESQLKRVFTKIIDDLGIYYKIGLSTDFTGKLFNEMYSWLGFSQDIESTHPGYDEYRYDLDSIGHNPHELASYLTALLQSYTPQSAQAELERIFSMQYTLTLTEEVEIRYRTETSTDPETGETTTEEVPYEYHILNVKLTNKPISELAEELLTPQQLEMYRVYLETSGNKPLIFGGGSPDGSPSEDLSGVEFVNGTRPGNQELMELAKQQVGNVGGYPYWSWYGFNSRVEWCACFVSWCYNQAGKSEPRFAGCEWQGVPWFQSRGQWGARGYENIAPGDAIFFDWDLDGVADHVGLVLGRDGSRVYTVEGNSGDACKIKSYDLNYQCIKGYGLMNW